MCQGWQCVAAPLMLLTSMGYGDHPNPVACLLLCLLLYIKKNDTLYVVTYLLYVHMYQYVGIPISRLFLMETHRYLNVYHPLDYKQDSCTNIGVRHINIYTLAGFDPPILQPLASQ